MSGVLALLLALCASAMSEYPMAEHLETKKFFIYPMHVENWYAFRVRAKQYCNKLPHC